MSEKKTRSRLGAPDSGNGGSRALETGGDQIYQSKIMLVDDEPLNMEVLMAHLEQEGYRNFITTSDSVTAFDKIVEEKPDVVLLDLMMPDVTGFDILSRVRQHDSLLLLPVVVLTSSDDSATKLKALQLGATDFLSKPVDASELALRLRNTLAARAYQYQLTHYDALTGLANGEQFSKHMITALEKHQQKKARAALLMVNINRFKHINDSYGREAGDGLLYEFSARMTQEFAGGQNNQALPQGHVRAAVYRLEGDKFAILIPFIGEDQDLINIISSAQETLDREYPIEGQKVFLQTAIGVSIHPRDGNTTEELVNRAETALVKSKQDSNSSFTFFCDGMDEQARKFHEIENGLRHALEKDEFFILYQPKVHVISGEIVGAEALVRWQHPEHGMVPPDQFISLAEESGQIVPIGNWVLKEALNQAAIWNEKGKTDFKMAVNVSIRQMMENDYIESVRSLVEESGLPAHNVQLELTENMIMDKAESNISILNQLKEIGVLLSIDDFGTGYSSLSYLQKFPIDELKIDQSFLREIQTPLDKAPIVKAVASLGHDLGLSLVAEGVETIHQLARIKALKCQIYQGYFCSPPIDAESFEELLFNPQVWNENTAARGANSTVDDSSDDMEDLRKAG